MIHDATPRDHNQRTRRCRGRSCESHRRHQRRPLQRRASPPEPARLRRRRSRSHRPRAGGASRTTSTPGGNPAPGSAPARHHP
ncbi:hypothetical protein FDZ84_29295 [Saccharopolyspora sp. ASAGF58]|nr:hypothetical protein FDZ84_29295 [Saccharopolyspora sp. ASAGF58]